MARDRQRARPLVRSTVVTAVVTVLVVLAVLDGPIRALLSLCGCPPGALPIWELIGRLTLGELALGISIVALLVDRRAARERRDDILRESNIAGRVAADAVFLRTPSLREIYTLAVETHERYYDETIGLFSSMLIDTSYRTRVLERLTLERGSARKTTRIEYLISAAEKDEMLARAASGVEGRGPDRPVVLVVPLLPVRKGSLLSGLVVTDQRGVKLSILTQPQTLGLVAIALSSYFSLAFPGVGLPAPADSDSPQRLFTEAADARLWRLRQIVLYPGIVERSRAEAAFDQAVAGLMPRDEAEYQRLRNVCLFFAENQFLACEVAIPEGFFISVQAEVDCSVVDHRHSREQRLRDFFGLEPYQYLVDLDMAHYSDNYHAELDGRDRHQYVYRQQVVDSSRGIPVDDSYFRSPDRQGQVIYQSEPTRVSPRVNVRNFIDAERPQLRWNVAVEEVPPGGLAPVLSLALIATVVAFCFAFIVPGVGSDDFDAPALVVALPLFVVTFFGFSFEKMSRSSLPAVIGFVVTSILVVISAILVLVSGKQPAGVARAPSVFGLWRIYDFSWPLLAVALSLLVVTLNLGFLGFRRVKRFRLLSDRDDRLNGLHEGPREGRR